jgi:uncharacterized DUF497 family protein
VQSLRFDWDPRKAAANRRRHRVSFEEARSVFLDDEALMLRDDEHSEIEQRFVIIGFSESLRILLVCHCDGESEGVIRIISARRANPSERKQYEERRTE